MSPPADEVWSYYQLVTGCPPSFSALPLCLSICLSLSMWLLRGWEWRGRKNISIQSSLQNLSSTKINSTMTPARLSCTVSKVSVECLTQAVGFLMGLFSQRLIWQWLFFCLNIYSLAGPKLWIFGRQIYERAVLLLLWFFGILFLKEDRKNGKQYICARLFPDSTFSVYLKYSTVKETKP